MKTKTHKITKLEAAKRQLKEAIYLFFDRRDPVAVHTLAAASLQILHDLAKGPGLTSFLKKNLIIRPEYEREWIKKIHEAENFFKHANRDPDKVLEFRPEITRFFLLDCLHLYTKLTEEWFHEGKVYFIWHVANYPKMIYEGEFKEQIKVLADKVDLNDFEFIQTMLKNPGLIDLVHLSQEFKK